jgi:hypothetical protein
MIYELRKNEFQKCKFLVCNHNHSEVKAIIEGDNPGRIFVDNYNSPNKSTCLAREFRWFLFYWR